MKEDFGGTSKRIAASNAITALTKSLKQNVNIDARFSMVTFSGNKTTGMWGQGDTKTWDDAEVAVSWTTDAGTIERYPNQLQMVEQIIRQVFGLRKNC